jgi:hypothetical protein
MTKNNIAACPYCGYDLKTMPERKRKCPSCAHSIYIKSTPENRVKRLMTEVQAKDAEKQWHMYNLRQKSISSLFPFGPTEQDIEKEKTCGAKSDSDAVVSLLTPITKETQDLHKRKMALSLLAVYAEEEGRPFHDYLAEAARCELLRYKQQRVKKVEIITADPGNACAECAAHTGKTFNIDDALRLMPLPCPTCTRTIAGTRPGFCRCGYVPAFD